MFDDLPAQTGLILFLVAAGVGPATYVVQHIRAGTSVRDVTAPAPDLSWRSGRQLLVSVLVLTVILAVGVFSFTPLAPRLVAWAGFAPTVLGVFASFALGRLVQGWRERRAEPLLRGVSLSYDRAEQPIAYWSSMTWNAILAGLMFLASGALYHDKITPRCDDSDVESEWVDSLTTCTTMLADKDLDPEDRSDILAARGRVHARLERNNEALADYSAALKLAPRDSYTLYNRALIYAQMGNYRRAIEDFDASLKLRPDDDDAYLQRGLAKLDAGDLPAAVADFTIAHERKRDDPYPLANRGIAYAWQNDPKRAEADFARVAKGEPAWIVVLRGRAILARHRKDQRRVIAHLSEALTLDPDDRFSLLMRADAYWAIGEADLSMADDARLAALDRTSPPGRGSPGQ
ncbi:tetratricopeptide repeat protein [Sphingomonas sp. R647]|uniref:tetratricopeptide repeat protein n=1 Tax=Sphingomonas sp. R647 TaxID=2875233 RepID=UPI001CD809F6|nr:tetratricopeptide repeat protein [Sphingomonas sp. R647]MCA1197364.1 tetratricopeptide repeat protein [Sphingomonas sp. R647]